MRWTKVGLGTAKFFCENILDIILCQLTKYQDQSFTSSDIDGQERKKEGESEVRKFGKTKSIFGNFFYFDSKNKNSGHKI